MEEPVVAYQCQSYVALTGGFQALIAAFAALQPGQSSRPLSQRQPDQQRGNVVAMSHGSKGLLSPLKGSPGISVAAGLQRLSQSFIKSNETFDCDRYADC